MLHAAPLGFVGRRIGNDDGVAFALARAAIGHEDGKDGPLPARRALCDFRAEPLPWLFRLVRQCLRATEVAAITTAAKAR